METSTTRESSTTPETSTKREHSPTDSVVSLEFLRRQLREPLTAARRQSLQHELARRSTPAQRAELDALLRRLPAAETADVRDLLYR